MPGDTPSRDQLMDGYLAQLPYPPYPVQERRAARLVRLEAGRSRLRAHRHGQDAHRPGGPFEALHTGTVAYYTTPLIALTEQKFQEMQACAVRWGFQAEDVGLVTGNRRVNPNARILVVVAEILLNRLLHAGWPTLRARRSISATSPPWSWTSSTTSPTCSAASSGNWRWRCCRRTFGLLLLSATVGNARSSSTGWNAATSASSNWSRARNARCR